MGPLEGITVVELSTMVAGPCAAKALRDWGARVIKVESPAGDLWRYMGAPMGCPAGPECNPVFDMENAGKEFLSLDVKRADDYQVLMELLGRADVFITNLRPNALDRLDLDYETLSRRFPSLVYGQVLGYGKTGPLRNCAAYDVTVFWGRTGLIDYLTPPGQPPGNISAGAMGDHITGMYLAGGIATALFRRERVGKGEQVCASLYQAGLHSLGAVVVPAQFAPLERQRTAFQSCGTNGVYRCKDGRYILFSITDVERVLAPLCRLMDMEELLEDRRFQTRKAIYQHQAEFRACLEDAMSRRSAAEWEPLLAEAGIPAQIIFTAAEAAQDVQAREAGFFDRHTYANGVQVNVPHTPLQYDSFDPPPITSCGPVGSDNARLLWELDEEASARAEANYVR